jgi:CHAT domain
MQPSSMSTLLGQQLVREKEVHDLSRNPEFSRFSFLGYHTSPTAVELVAFRDADGLAEGEIVRLRDEFFDLLRTLPHRYGLRPRGRNPNGLLGFVFAEGCPEAVADFIGRQTRVSHAASTGAVAVSWAIDVPNRRIRTHDNPVSLIPPVIVVARTVYPGLAHLESLLDRVPDLPLPPVQPPRRREPSMKPPSESSEPPVHVLFLSANSTASPLDLERELERIETNLRMGRDSGRLHLKPVMAGTFSRLSRAMLDDSPTIVHFSGHGRQEGIILRGDDGEPRPVSGEALASLFENFRDTMTCVVLNACWSEHQAHAIHRHIPYVVGMRDRIPDRTAIAFATGFYQAIADGRDVPFAFNIGIAHAQADGDGGVDRITLLSPGSV